MDHQIVLILSMIVTIVTVFLFPLFANINIMYFIIFVAGISNGTIDTMGNCWIIHLWGVHNPPFMQFLHFAYGLGAFIAPFLVNPFLLNKETDNQLSVSNSSEPDLIGTSNDVKIQWPFIILSILYLLVLVIFIVIYIYYPENSIHPSRIKRDDNVLDQNEKKDKYKLNSPLSKWLNIFVICIATISMHAYVGVEISFGSLLSPFAVKSNLHMSKSEGSFLTSTYWATYTFLRIFSLIGIIYLSPQLLLIINFGIVMLSNCILVPFANEHRWALWTGSALIGLGCSSIFATMFAFLGECLSF